ncbi:hypothetical protein FHS59_001752 [Algoriphagus iocasae]|uniref:DUF983 domain-containing protein n=1 Tax=Algoriphagus iocasae TaxID=1836499 RepID=A0A841MMV6_9BACT|nr:DUF983 domain-containing protein [Algoriphagus iocasae]MBB6326124.1 hypothetical protein [Algoriphagus iocasae]
MFQKMDLKKPASLFEMKQRCEYCQQSFEPEPGYYFGAMFISYALNTALFIAVWLGLEIFYPEYSLSLLLTLIVISAILLLPFFFRISRSAWIAIFIPYQASKETR